MYSCAQRRLAALLCIIHSIAGSCLWTQLYFLYSNEKHEKLYWLMLTQLLKIPHFMVQLCARTRSGLLLNLYSYFAWVVS